MTAPPPALSLRREHVLLAGVLAVGALVRLYRLDLTWFLLDQARDASVASGIASWVALPLLGPRVGWTDAYLGPLYFYLLAIPFLLARDPAVAVAFVSASNLLAAFLLYRFVREFFGARPALYAAALFVVFPLAIFSSRLVWHTGLLPLFSILLLRSLCSLIVKRRSWAVVPTIGLLAVVTQLHLTSAALALVVALAAGVFRPRVRPVHALLGAGIFLLLYAPYVAYELTHDFENIRSLLRFALGRDPAEPGSFWSLLGNVLVLFRPALAGFTVETAGPPTALAAFAALLGVEALAFNAGVLLCLYRVLAPGTPRTTEATRARQVRVVLLLWLALPLAMLGSHQGVVWWYYLDALYPSQFVFAGLALSAVAAPTVLPARARPWLGRAVAGLVLALVGSQVYFLLAFQEAVIARGRIVLGVPHLSINGTVSPFDTLTSLPLRYRRDIVRVLVEDFGLDMPAFRRRVHGLALGLPDESEYLVHQFADGRAAPASADPAAPHYVVEPAEAAGPVSGVLGARRVGPYVIAKYRPHIDYQSWSYTVTPQRDVDGLVPARWRSTTLPAGDLNLWIGDGSAALWSGHLRLPPAGEQVRITVSTVGDAPLDVIAVEVDGRRLPRIATRVRQSPLMLRRASGSVMGIGWTSESVFALQGPAATGPGRVLLAVVGHRQMLGFDVYETRAAAPAGAGPEGRR